jgi:hypothetical protein
MKKFKAFLILLFCCSAAFSQKVYFMYLQSDGAQPFFLKMNEQVYSSNTSGYLILSKLQDSIYRFSIGFPQNKWPEQAFNVSIGSRDRGFSLKNTGDKDWVLLDLQTQQTIQGQPANKEKAVRTEPKEVSAFTEALSKAANDPSLKVRVIPQVAVAKVEEKPAMITEAVKQETVPVIPPPQEKKEEIAVQAKDTAAQQPALAAAVPVPATTLKKEEITEPVKDTALVQQTAVIPPPEEKKTLPAEEKKQEIVQVKEPIDTLSQAAPVVTEKPAEKKEEQAQAPIPPAYKPTVVIRKTESSTSEGFGVTYIDQYPDGKKDTVQIFIPNPKTITRQVPPPQEETQFLPMDTEAKDLTPAKKPLTQNAGKNDCAAMASETDFLKLRKKMVATEGDDAMLAAAKKVFKTKCFTTEQVKNLGTLFLNDAGRYNFFDAAYLAASDKENFVALESELKDAYYISRFKAMLR